MVMETQQLQCSDQNRPHKMATVLTVSNSNFWPGHTPHGSTSWTQILYFPCVRITQTETQPSGFDNRTDLTEKLSRKSETAL